MLRGARELLHPQQDVGVLDACLAVVGSEFHAALEKELGFVVDLVACRDLREQPHALDVGLVIAQKVLAQALGVGEPVFRQVADDGNERRRQGAQEVNLLLRRGQLVLVAAVGIQLGQALPAIDQ